MKRLFFILLCLCCSIGFVFSQNDFSCPQVDCPGQCGAFIDENHDGFCDHGQLSDAAKKQLQANEQKEEKIQTAKQSVKKVEPDAPVIAETPLEEQQEEFLPATEEANTQPAPSVARGESPYHLISITIGLLLLYAVSLIFAQKQIIMKNTHRKIWNIVLLVAFLVSGLLGLVLTGFINYGYRPDCYMTLKSLHVEFGIVLAVVSIFHILWHIPYFKNLLHNKHH